MYLQARNGDVFRFDSDLPNDVRNQIIINDVYHLVCEIAQIHLTRNPNGIFEIDIDDFDLGSLMANMFDSYFPEIRTVIRANGVEIKTHQDQLPKFRHGSIQIDQTDDDD